MWMSASNAYALLELCQLCQQTYRCQLIEVSNAHLFWHVRVVVQWIRASPTHKMYYRFYCDNHSRCDFSISPPPPSLTLSLLLCVSTRIFKLECFFLVSICAHPIQFPVCVFVVLSIAITFLCDFSVYDYLIRLWLISTFTFSPEIRNKNYQQYDKSPEKPSYREILCRRISL